MGAVDYKAGSTFRAMFNTIDGNGALVTLSGGAAVVQKNDTTTTFSTGLTLSIDYGGVTGKHLVKVVLTDPTYDAGSYFAVSLSAGTADGVSQVGMLIGEFTVGRHAYANANGNLPANVFEINDVTLEGSGTVLDPMESAED